MGGARLSRLWAGPWVPASFGKAPYLWALCLSFLLWKYLFVRPGVLEMVLLAATIVAFLPVYFASFWGNPRYAVLLVLVACLMGTAWAPVNIGASSFFVFAASMCAGILPVRRAYLGVALVMLLALASAVNVPAMRMAFLMPSLGVGLLVGLATVMEATLRRSRDQLLRKQEEVEHLATLAERERISRDLHDLLGHTLSLITLKAELAGKLVGRDAAACRQEIADIEHSARNALAEVRAAVTGYRQSGLAHELANARASLAAAGITLQADMAPLAVPVATEHVLALALREAVTNILRHARASACTVRLEHADGQVRLRIADNGAPLAPNALQPGNGLRGMQERVAGAGGQLRIVAGHGLALELTLPAGG